MSVTRVVHEGEWASFIEQDVLSLVGKNSGSVIFGLVGDLGAGKTTFSKEFLRLLGVTAHMQSPTFSILNSYDIAYQGYTKAIHVDTYRIEDNKELEVLHFAELLENPAHIVLIEWADKIKELMPANTYWFTFEHTSPDTRTVTITQTTDHGTD